MAYERADFKLLTEAQKSKFIPGDLYNIPENAGFSKATSFTMRINFSSIFVILSNFFTA